MACFCCGVTIVEHYENPYGRRETLTPFLPAMNAADKLVNTTFFTFGDIFEGCPRFVLQADGCFAPRDNKIVADQGGACPG
jgi:hypothetical protein